LEVSNLELYDNNPLKYLYNQYVKMHFKIPDADVYHALSTSYAHTFHKDKTVVTIHDVRLKYSCYSHQLNRKGKLIARLTDKHKRDAVLNCKHIIAISDEMKEGLINYFNVDPDKISVINVMHIEDDLFYKPKESETYNIGLIGNLSSRIRRFDVVIKVFKKANIDNSRLLIGGGENDYLKKLASGDDKIKFLGFIPYEKVGDFYNDLDVLIIPSKNTGYPLPVAEAMKCRKPVITHQNFLLYIFLFFHLSINFQSFLYL
jgi:glycosyltransferase involved in cell wall biosynthesis